MTRNLMRRVEVVVRVDDRKLKQEMQELLAGAYIRPLLSSTKAVLVTPPRVPLSNRLGVKHVANISHLIR
jgi:hypothetical protein